jgi:hypothetical protein
MIGTISVSELEIAADGLNDEDLQDYLKRFLVHSSKELGWTMKKFFDEIECDLFINYPDFRALDL